MPDTEGSRLATLEEALRGIRLDMADQLDEMKRTRDRLHELESTAQALVLTNAQRERTHREAQDKQLRWIQLLTLVVALAGVIGPLVYTGTAH